MMNLRIAATAVVVSVAMSGTALADCALSQKEFNNQIVTGKLRADHYRSVAKDLRLLRRAATSLEKLGHEDACEEVVAAMRRIAEKPPQGQALRLVSKIGGKLRVDELLEAEVRASDGEWIGDVENVILDTKGAPSYVIIEYGGFLGLGEEQAAIPFKSLRVTPDRAAFYLPITKTQFDKAPKFKRNAFNWTEDRTWRDRLDQYYTTSGKGTPVVSPAKGQDATEKQPK